MLIAPHAAAGIAIGSLTSRPLIIVPAAIATHYLLDTVPHWQETLAPYIPTAKTYVRIFFDLLLAAGLIILAIHWLPQNSSAIWIGAVVANIPDLDSIVVLIPNFKKGLVKRYWDWHCKIQHETSLLWGIATQAGLIIVTMLVVYAKS